MGGRDRAVRVFPARSRVSRSRPSTSLALLSPPLPPSPLSLLSQDSAAVDLADFAGRAGTPVLRVAPTPEAVNPHFERPAALILGSGHEAGGGGGGRGSGDARAMDPHAGAALIPAADVASHLPALRAALSNPDFTRPAFSCSVPPPDRVWTAWPPAPDADDAPLGLVMIVKDEAQSIGATLASAKAHIDGWTLVDTGSTDGTQDAIRAALGEDGPPGRLLSSPFVDFSATRNGALLAHGRRTFASFMPDADFRFTNLWRLRLSAERLERACRTASPAPACGKAWLVSRKDGGLIFRMQVAWPSAGQGTVDAWHYEYPVHEVSGRGREHGGDAVDFPHSTAMVWIEGVVHNKSQVRWREFDLRVLTAECAAKPTNTRVHFYLARTYMQVGEWEEAIKAFQKRIDMGGWYEEVFQSMLDQGRALVRLGRDPTARFRAAFEYCPWRAEPLYELTMWHEEEVKKCDGGTPFLEACRMSHRAAGYWAAKTAASLPAPDRDRLFVWAHVYDHQAALQKAVHAYYLAEAAIGVLEDGAGANAALLARFPGKAPYSGNAPLFEGLAKRFYANAPPASPPAAAPVATPAAAASGGGGPEGEASVEEASAAAAAAAVADAK